MKVSSFLKRAAVVAVGAVAFFAPGAARAATYYVGSESGDSASVTAALSAIAASPDPDGDEVVIRSGTYSETAECVLSDKITVRSATGRPGDVILKGQNSHRLFVLNHAEAKVSAVTIQECLSGSTYSYQGGGVHITSNGGTLEKSVVHSCRANGNSKPGGCVYQAGGLVDCCVISNGACHKEGEGGGTGLAVFGGVARNCLITKNVDGGTPTSGYLNNYGGAVMVNGGTIVNCTIAGNNLFRCPGVWAKSGKVLNCIIAENVSERWTDPTNLTYVGAASCFSNCLGTAKINDTCYEMAHPFQNFAAGDFSPIIGSVGVDTGSEADWMATATDLKGNPRKSGTKPDIGAIERDQSSLCANFSASPSFGTAPLTVTFTPTVCGASGTVTYDWDFDGDGVADSHDAQPVVTFDTVSHHPVKLTVKDGTQTFTTPYAVPVKVFGEEIRVVKNNANAAPPYDTWANAAASLETAYDYAEAGTVVVLSNATYMLPAEFRAVKPVVIRSFTGNPTDVILKADRTKGDHRVIQLGHPEAKISGVTITNGQMPFEKLAGAGVFISSYGGLLEKSVIHGCSSSLYAVPGGGLYIDSGAANALVDRCVISNCTADCHGGGGGLAAAVFDGVVRNCLITENKFDNKDSSTSGTVKLSGGRLVNCTVVRNTVYYCPGVWATSGHALNCIIAKNESLTSSDPSYVTYAGTASCFSNCVGTAAINETCAGMEDPFVDYAKKNYTVALGTTPVDFGIKEDWMTGALDLAGNPRLSGAKPDAGAYEADQSHFSAGFKADVTSGFAPLTVTFTATVYGAVGEVTYYWDWNGDGIAEETNKTNVTQHEFTTAGSANVGLTVKNGDQASTVFTVENPVKISALSKYIYVSKTSANPGAPYADWNTAAHTVEEAFAAAIEGCEVIVSNGTHDIAAEVKILTGVTIRGVTGKPEDVILKAKGTHRMFLLSAAAAQLASLTIQGGNSGGLSGGGIYIDTAGGTVSNCIVRGCSATGNSIPGGGIYVKSGASQALVDRCVISNCIAHCQGNGGGMAIALYGGEARNCLIAENVNPSTDVREHGASAKAIGGGRLVNCTITKNSAYVCPGVYAEGTGRVINCIIAENTHLGTMDAKSSCWSGTDTCYSNCVGTAAMNESCQVLAHPFADSAHRDYTPLAGTAAVDGGIKEDWMEGAKDLIGNARVSGGKPDAGAIEFDQSSLAVAYTVNVASGKAPLPVTFTAKSMGAQGTVTYCWDLDGNGSYETETDNPVLNHTFTTPCAVAVGLKIVDSGVSPVAEAVASVKTTIRAFGEAIFVSKTSANPAEPYDTWEKAARNVPEALAVACDECEIVVSNGTYDIAAEQQVLKGVTIRGLTGDFKDVTLKSKQYSGNHRLFWLGHAHAKLQDLTLRDATLTVKGAGAYIDANGGTILRCRFLNCTASAAHAAGGGGVYVVSGSPNARIESCVFTGGASHSAGGGSAIYLNSGLAFNCTVTNNSSYSPVLVAGGTFANSLVLNNKNSPSAPGVYASGGEVINCIIAGNTTKTAAGAWTGTAACFANCIMDVETLPNGTCVTEDPTFTFRNFANCDYRLNTASKGRDGGVYREWMATAKDVRGQPRKLGTAPDCGIYETGGGFTLIVR